MITQKLLLHFPQSATEKPIVYHLVKDYNLIINIFRARVTPEEDGFLVLDVTGNEEDIRQGMAFVKSFNIQVNEANKGVRWDSSKCVQCGNCIPHCPTEALYISDKKSRKIDFNSSLCVECLSCIENCPFGACSSIF